MKKILAIVLIVLFTLMIIGQSSQAGKTPHLHQGDVAGFLGEIIGYLLLYVGLYYSTKWLMKLSGRSYKVGRQTLAALLFWYSCFAAFFGLTMMYLSVPFGAGVLVIWSGIAYVCRRWQKRLWAAEHAERTAHPVPA